MKLYQIDCYGFRLYGWIDSFQTTDRRIARRIARIASRQAKRRVTFRTIR